MTGTGVRHRRVAGSDGTWIAYRVHGEKGKPWLVLTNGAGCSEHYWTAKLIPRLKSDFHIIEWDYRGHYDSGPAPHRDAYTVQDHARDLLAVVGSESVEKAVFLGFSLGVQVTLEAYSASPELFSALCFVNGSYEDPLGSMWGTGKLRPLIAAVLELGSRLPSITALLERLILGGPLALHLAKLNRFCEHDVPEEPFNAYMKKVSRIDPVAYMRTLRLMGEHSAGQVLPRVRVPVLLFAGDEDTMTPLSKMQKMAEDMPDAELIVVPGGRHTLLFTKGDWIAEKLLEFSHQKGIL